MNKNIIYLIMTIIGGILLMGTTVFLLMNWSQVPDQIPIHFNFAGEVTDYGGKGSLIMLLLVAWFTFVLITVLVHFPKTWNIPVKVTEENYHRIYSITRGILETVKLVVLILMVTMIITSANGTFLSAGVVMIFVAIILLITFGGIFLLYRNR